MPGNHSPRIDRRSEPRLSATGEVQLRLVSAPAQPFTGQLLDTARHGFRVIHDRRSLVSGDLVNFEFSGRRGLARAMWTRISGKQVETGFRICEERPPGAD